MLLFSKDCWIMLLGEKYLVMRSTTNPKVFVYSFPNTATILLMPNTINWTLRGCNLWASLHALYLTFWKMSRQKIRLSSSFSLTMTFSLRIWSQNVIFWKFGYHSPLHFNSPYSITSIHTTILFFCQISVYLHSHFCANKSSLEL